MSSAPARVDVHQHLLPSAYRSALARHHLDKINGTTDLPAWSVASALSLMDSQGIATSVLSISTPGVHLGDASEARALATTINDGQAELVKDRPDRFGMFASVPLPDVDASLEVIRHAYDDLSADGVVLHANTEGVYLGHRSFDPLLAELDRRNAVIFVHPGDLPGPPAEGVPPFAADFLLDTTRAAISMVVAGVPRRYPNLRVILAHGGGFLPYASHRIAAGLSQSTDLSRAEILTELAGFYFDTAVSSSSAALPTLLEFAPPGHVLYGSDWPFAPDPTVSYFTESLDGYAGLDESDRRAEVDHVSAMALFPRLADRIS